MANPNPTVIYSTPPYGLTGDWRKYVIQSATPNDTRLDFSPEQKALTADVDTGIYDFPSYPKPYTTYRSKDYKEGVDICFARFQSPGFRLWLEKIKVCLHQPSTYGCIKVNVWNFGSSFTSTPINLVEIQEGQPSTTNIPLTILPENKLVSNVLEKNDLYMLATKQEAIYTPYQRYIEANSLLRFGIQYAEGNAYGLKVFLVCWALKCDKV